MSEGTSRSSDLETLPIVFLLVLALAVAAYWLVRRFGPQPPPAIPDPPPSPPVTEAIGTLRAAGLDVDGMLGPWLAAARTDRP